MDRRIYADFSSRGVDRSPAAVLMVVSMVVRDELVDEVDKWYEEVSACRIPNLGVEE